MGFSRAAFVGFASLIGAGAAWGGCGLVVDVPEGSGAGSHQDQGGAPGSGGGVVVGGQGGDGGAKTTEGGSGGDSPCADDLVECGGECVDVDEDEAHCGGCDHDCRGGTCVAGLCPKEVIVTGRMNASWDIVVTPDELVWSGEPVMRAPLGSLADALPLVPLARYLCLVKSDIFAMTPSMIVKVPVDGSSLAANFVVVDTPPSAIAANESHLFWLDPSGLYRASGDDPATKEPIDGPTPASFYIAADTTHVYIAQPQAPGLRRIDLTSLDDEVVMANQPAAHIALDTVAQRVFYTSNSTVGYVGMDGMGGPQQLVGGQQQARGIAIDGPYVYWVDRIAGRLQRVPKAGGEPVVLATGLDGPVGVAVDATHAYFTEETTGSMSRVAK